jgi:uncharacterized membrane protein YfcA
MSIYLPIAEIPIDVFLLMLIGMAGGILAGLFGIGGGFLITPVLIFIGIPPSVAVATSANQIIASSVTGFYSYWYRNSVDIKMGLYLLVGGAIGSYIGVVIFAILKSLGQIDLAISLIYVVFLGTIGAMMAYESGNLLLKGKLTESIKEFRKDNLFNLSMVASAPMFLVKTKLYLKRFQLPYVIEFPKSQLKISAFMPIMVGAVAGIMVSIMGIGGGFIMMPAMLYLLKMPSNMVVGTSLFQIIFTTSFVTVLHAITTQTVDILLAFILIIGGVFGAQIGSRLSTKLPAEKLRFFLAVLILSLCVRLAVGLFFEPREIYTIEKVAD